MKNCSKLIYSLLIFLCNLILINGDSCYDSTCSRYKNNTVSTSNDVSIKYPFYIKDQQPKACGKPDFELYCNDLLGTLVQFPNNVVLGIDGIFYYDQQILLSDPFDNCLPRKLMFINLTNTNTPFYVHGMIKKFWVYNCSGEDYRDYDKIDCLSGENYTVISSGNDKVKSVESSNCTFWKIVNVPVSGLNVNLSSISSFYLAWNDGTLMYDDPTKEFESRHSSKSRTAMIVLAMTGGVILVVCLHYFWIRYANRYSARMNAMDTIHTINTTPNIVVGLDQATIDSYPVTVVGASGRIIKPDDNACPICLSDYIPGDTLKLLPECLHRFHGDCIDQWLRSKGDCPICRTSPLRISSHE